MAPRMWQKPAHSGSNINHESSTCDVSCAHYPDNGIFPGDTGLNQYSPDCRRQSFALLYSVAGQWHLLLAALWPARLYRENLGEGDPLSLRSGGVYLSRLWG